MRDIRVGVIGCGGIAESSHLPAYRYAPGVEIVAVSDIDRTRLAQVSSRFNVKKTYLDYHSLLQKEETIDAVSVCLPTYLHKDAVITASENHKQILCEKPLACTVADARDMTEVTKRCGVQLYVGFPLRFAKVFRSLKRYVHNGSIGKPFKVEIVAKNTITRAISSWYFDRRQGGGALFDAGSHLIDLLGWIFGDMTLVSGSFVKGKTGADIESKLELILSDGLRGMLMVSWRSSPDQYHVKVEGTKGMIVADLIASSILVQRPSKIMGRFTGGAEILVEQRLSMYWKEIWGFLDILREKENSDVHRYLATAQDGLQSLQLIESAYKKYFT
jgi:UDP-N-acetylglucosamine 3-dehydrogenase